MMTNFERIFGKKVGNTEKEEMAKGREGGKYVHCFLQTINGSTIESAMNCHSGVKISKNSELVGDVEEPLNDLHAPFRIFGGDDR